MCLVNFHFQEHPTYKLIVAANRDEFYERPTAPAHFWNDMPFILAGRDLLQKGTWLGVTKTGRFAALTNYRKPGENSDNKISRGEIVTYYLTGTTSPNTFLNELSETSDHYAGFNVLVGNSEQLYYFNNIEKKVVKVSPGTHSLSNHFLNTPWPKVTKGREKLHEYVKSKNTINTEDLFAILSDAERASDEYLPQTGISHELERELSPLFIQTDQYGTRSSTVLTIDHHGNVQFIERTFKQGTFASEEQFYFNFKNSQN